MEAVLLVLLFIAGIIFCVMMHNSAQKTKARLHNRITLTEYGQIKKANSDVDYFFDDLFLGYITPTLSQIKSKFRNILSFEIQEYNSSIIKTVTNGYKDNLYRKFNLNPKETTVMFVLSELATLDTSKSISREDANAIVEVFINCYNIAETEQYSDYHLFDNYYKAFCKYQKV